MTDQLEFVVFKKKKVNLKWHFTADIWYFFCVPYV